MASRFNPFTRARDYTGPAGSPGSLPDTTAENDFIVGSSTIGTWVKKSLAQTITILRGSLDSVYTTLTAVKADTDVASAISLKHASGSDDQDLSGLKESTFVVAPSGGDYTDIQTAIDALPSTGGKIVVMAGTYTPTADITLNKANTILEGCGNSTIIQSSTNAVNAGVIKMTAAGCVVRNMKVAGSRATYPNARGIVMAADYCVIEQVNVVDVGKDGIKCEGANYGIIRDNKIGSMTDADKVGQDGIWLDLTSTNCLVQGNTVVKALCVGIEADSSCHHVKIVNNMMLYCAENGDDTWGGMKVLGNQGGIISGNVIQSSYQHGIYVLNSADDLSIHDNSIYSCGKHGIWLSGVSNCQVVGNKFWGSWGDTNTYDAINISGNANNNLVSSNIGVTAKYRYGINIVDSTCDTNAVIGNRFASCGTGEINDAGTGTVKLGDSAAKNVGTGSTNVAAGDHAHTGTYAPVLGNDDNYVTDTEKSALHAAGSDTSLGSGAVALDHGTAATDMIVNVCYGTGDPPTASDTTEGALYVKYTA